MGKYINPFTDEGFKRIFGQEINKDLLIDFLNSLIQNESPIVDIEYRDKEHMPHFYDGRRSIYDIYATTQNGELVIIEMQNATQSFFRDRSIYYVASALAEQGERGKDWDFNVSRVYGVFFLNFFMDNRKDLPLNMEVNLRVKENNELFSDKLRMFYITLPRMSKEEDECETDFERWIYILKHMETLERMPFKAKNAIFGKLDEVCNLHSLTREERRHYDASLKIYRDNVACYNGAYNEGIAEGRAEGRVQGRAEGRAEEARVMAKKLKEKGLDLAMIAEVSGLDVSEIESL